MTSAELHILLIQFFEAGKVDGNLYEIIGDTTLWEWLRSEEEVLTDTGACFEEWGIEP